MIHLHLHDELSVETLTNEVRSWIITCFIGTSDYVNHIHIYINLSI